MSLSRIVLVIFLSLAAVMASPNSRADDTAYAGVDLNGMTLDISNASYSPKTVGARVGLTIFPDMVPAISLESHMGVGVGDDTQAINGSNVKVRLATYLGIYVRGDFNLMQKGSLYLLLGAASAQLSGPFGSNNALPNDDTDSGYSYGVGASYTLPWDLKLYLEYTQLVDGNSFRVSGIGLGVTHSIE